MSDQLHVVEGNAERVAAWLIAHPELAAEWAATHVPRKPRILSTTQDAVRARARRTAMSDEERMADNARVNAWHKHNPQGMKASRKRTRTAAYQARQKAAAMIRRQTKREWFLWRNAKYRAIDRGIEFTITLADIVIPAVCPVFGVPFDMAGSQDRKRMRMAPSLDRIDNRFGYVPGNVMVISLRANQIKTDATAQEIRAVAEFCTRIEVEREAKVKAE